MERKQGLRKKKSGRKLFFASPPYVSTVGFQSPSPSHAMSLLGYLRSEGCSRVVGDSIYAGERERTKASTSKVPGHYPREGGGEELS